MSAPNGNYFFRTPGGSASSSGTLSVVSKSSGYVATTSDDVILCSGSAFTVTLYAAAGNVGKVLKIKKVDSSLVNVITIDGNLSETIDGQLTTTLNTIYEEVELLCDGSNWHLLTRLNRTNPTTYTPTFYAFGTVTTSNFFSYRDGKNLIINGDFIKGTPGASGAAFSIGFGGSNVPPGLLIDLASLGGGTFRPVGQYSSKNTGGTVGFVLTVAAGATNLGFGPPYGFTATVSAAQTNGNSGGGTTDAPVTGPLIIPIVGWNG